MERRGYRYPGVGRAVLWRGLSLGLLAAHRRVGKRGRRRMGSITCSSNDRAQSWPCYRARRSSGRRGCSDFAIRGQLTDLAQSFRRRVLRHPIGAWNRTALSLDPLSTATSAVGIASLTLLFIGCARRFESAGVGDITRGVMVVGVVLALAGIASKPTTSGTIYGFWKPRFGIAGFGPFVNPNHFAGWMMMALPIVLVYFLASVSKAMRGVQSDWRSRVLWFSSTDANTLLLVGLSAILMGSALVLTFSRAGIACLALSLLLSGWFTSRRQAAGARRSLALAYVVLVALVGVSRAGVDAVAREFGATSWALGDGRVAAWEQGLNIISDFTLTGTGMNTYGIATQLYAPDTGERFIHAFNDYIQLFAEGGLLVGLPLLVAASVFARDVARRFRLDEDDETTRWIRTGAVTGLAAIALQEVVDYSLQMPGNMVMFTVLCAIAVHHPRGTRRTRSRAVPGTALSSLRPGGG